MILASNYIAVFYLAYLRLLRETISPFSLGLSMIRTTKYIAFLLSLSNFLAQKSTAVFIGLIYVSRVNRYGRFHWGHSLRRHRLSNGHHFTASRSGLHVS